VVPEAKISLPYSAYTGSALYMGEVSFKQMFMYIKGGYVVKDGKKEFDKSIKHTEIPVKIHVKYQVCNDTMCMPPEEHVINMTIPINDNNNK
jgi:hypothetical protein